MKANVHPLDILFRLAEEHGIVLLNGGGFAAPNWSTRVSLANLDDAAYANIGRAVRAVATKCIPSAGAASAQRHKARQVDTGLRDIGCWHSSTSVRVDSSSQVRRQGVAEHSAKPCSAARAFLAASIATTGRGINQAGLATSASPRCGSMRKPSFSPLGSRTAPGLPETGKAFPGDCRSAVWPRSRRLGCAPGRPLAQRKSTTPISRS